MQRRRALRGCEDGAVSLEADGWGAARASSPSPSERAGQRGEGHPPLAPIGLRHRVEQLLPREEVPILGDVERGLLHRREGNRGGVFGGRSTGKRRIPGSPVGPEAAACPPNRRMEVEAWIRMYREELPPLYRLVSRRVGGARALAEDVVQETWLRALDNWPKRGVPRDPGAWLRTVASNLLRQPLPQRPAGRPRSTSRRCRRTRSPIPRPRGKRPAFRPASRVSLRLRPTARAPLPRWRWLGGARRELGLGERALEGRLRRARAALARRLGGDPQLESTALTEGEER